MPKLRSVRMLWEPRDLWVGAYWRMDGWGVVRELTIYLCILPCVSLKMVWRTR